jgi:hypothetical protein
MPNWPMARLIAEMRAAAEHPDDPKSDLPPLKGLEAFESVHAARRDGSENTDPKEAADA